MKILYLTKGDHIDYQDDCLFIGLRELFGKNVVDYNQRKHNYVSYNEEAAKKLYGMGMTVSRVLPDIEVDRTDITAKIKNKYFDYIVYGSIWRCSDYIDNILKYYSKNKVIAVDGEDETNVHPLFKTHNILYFKRELTFKGDRIFPISFSFPTLKVDFVKTNKTRDKAFCDPSDKRTYIYKNESDYYQGYKESRFGRTIKKAGWDCMRHYEILANGCLPAIGLRGCPEQTMTSFPKQLCLKIKEEFIKGVDPAHIYECYVEEFEKHFLANNTTKAEAMKFINAITSI